MHCNSNAILSLQGSTNSYLFCYRITDARRIKVRLSYGWGVPAGLEFRKEKIRVQTHELVLSTRSDYSMNFEN